MALTVNNNSTYTVTPWQEFFSRDLDFQQGEHVTEIATTGQGKTTLELQLVTLRDHVMFLGTKSEDETQEELGPLGFKFAHNVDEIIPEVSHKWVVNPGTLRKGESVTQMYARQRKVFTDALHKAYVEGRWCVCVDEGRYVCDYLSLKGQVALLYLQGRSQKNSVIMGTQRPRWVPLEAFDQATHLFFWKDNDRQNIARVSEMASLRRDAVMDIVPRLKPHQFLYVNTRTDLMVISKVDS